jgi:mRNA-degrading endonuclease RelE of RelBE toxin-antitoxin system
MVENPFSGDILKLEGRNNRWRRRAGSYRIFFTVDTRSRLVAISAVVRRTSTTY